MRVDAAFQSGNVHALFAPLVRADEPQQLAQRRHIRFGGRAVGFQAGLLHIGRAAQRNGVVGVEGNQQHAQNVCALPLLLAVPVESLRRGVWLCACFASAWRLAIQPTHQGLQQMPGVLKVALPQERGAFTGQLVGPVGGHAVVGQHHTLVRGEGGFRAPQGPLCGVVGVGPVKVGGGIHAGGSVAGTHLPDSPVPRGLARGCAASYTLARC